MYRLLSIVLVAVMLSLTSVAQAQDVVELSPSSTRVTQNFDDMWDAETGTAGLMLPDGWRVERNMSAPRTLGSFAGASTSVMYTGGTSLASNASNGTWNFVSSTVAGDCSVGGLSTTVTNGTRCINVMARLHNSGDEAVSKLSLSYDIEKYRNGDNEAGFLVQLYTSSDGATWTSAGEDFYRYFAPDAATQGAATVPISVTEVADKQLKVDVPAGEDLYLAWNISVASGSSPNKAMGLSIDNVVIDATFASQDRAAYIYVEDVTKWSALYMAATGAQTIEAQPAQGSAVVNGVTYKVWQLALDGGNCTLTFSNGGNKSQTVDITASRDYYFCLTGDAATEIDDPQSYTGYVDPTRPPFVASGIYLRGEVNSWSASADWEFSDEGNGVYALYDKTLSGNFKVADANWSSACNYGSNGSTALVDEPYALLLGTNDNISCGANTYVCKRIVVTIDASGATLLLQSDDDDTDLTTVYVIGDNNGWNYMDASGALALVDGTTTFAGRITMPAGSDGNSRWRIYQRLGMGGVWGAEEDLAGDNTEGVLLKGSKGSVSTAPGTYDMTFDLASGRYSLVKAASTPTSMTLQPANTILVPQLPDEVKVLSLNNSLIYYNDQDAMFNDIAAAMGKNAHWTKHTLLGKSLQAHWDEGDGVAEDGNPGAKMLVRSEAWSHIILQEQSSLPRTDVETFRSNLARWIDYIRDYCPNPNAIIIVPINWAYSGDWSNYTDFNKTFVSNCQDVAVDLGVTLCPVGVAYQDVYDAEGASGAATWFLDDRHPTPKATYMAATMEYGLIFGEDPASVNYVPEGVTSGEAASMRGYASNALNNFTNFVDHTAGVVRYRVTVRDQFGMEVAPPEPVVMTVDGGGVMSDNVFEADGTLGTYAVGATCGTFALDATVTVAAAETEVVTYPAIELNEERLSAAEDFDAMGDAAEATLPDAWRIDRILTAPRTVGRFDQADTQTMYSGGVNLPSNAKNGTWNFGADDDSDRALGGISTGVANATRCVNVYAHLLNTGRKNLVNVNVGYNVEKYRKGSNSAGFVVQLYYSVDGRNWTSAGDDFRTYFAPDAETAGYASVPGETVAVNGVLGTTLARGCDLYLAWNITVASGDAAQAAMAIGIDDFTITAELPQIPASQHYIYVEDLTGWAALGLYAWGDGELFGTWPGEASVGDTDIEGVNYKVFLLDTEGGNYHLIFNNWNNGSQLPDYDIVANRDYYFQITSSTVIEKEITGVVSVKSANDIRCHGDMVYYSGRIDVYNVNGQLVAGGRDAVSLSALGRGLYIVRATDGTHTEAMKLIR